MKLIPFSLAVVVTTALSVSSLVADVYYGSTVSFSGVITAIETDRDSFTVENSDGIVKMFQVSPSRKSSLTPGNKVTVSYQEGYRWPLKTTSISGGGYIK